ncbi:FISUMP domain-containing protein [Labilibaculum sp. K2S]|uniref:FISUMP domain-containing protein n=1 Tax=Labilibaculum sp. K2S TaxID=3056386 RepID=UPI0025A33B31|nr:FISUMP domain-containing protein [Labilibaculum sp. K2S]MDM8162170.1 FISUMP domain-containing protein [Labilibaculum sp. K2S]
MCHNLGADQSLDPDVPVEGIHGNYYQWGKKDAYANTSAIYGAWSRTPAADGTWSDDSKTSRDPCPAGYRVPTENQWYGVANYNTAFRTGSWADDGNFTTALHFGPDAGTKTLTLPATGFRDHIDAAVWNRGAEGYYWSSTVSYTDAWAYRCQSSIASSGATTSRASGSSVRCISE